VPYNADNIGVLNPASGSFTTINIFNTNIYKYHGGVLGPNGKIYFVPAKEDNIGVLNPASGSFTTIDISSTISGWNKYLGSLGLSAVCEHVLLGHPELQLNNQNRRQDILYYTYICIYMYKCTHVYIHDT